jgi:hypothetical protein
LKRAVLIAVLAFGCSSSSLDGLAAAVDHGGPKVQFDLAAAPLPQVPFPNDVLTTDDSSSPTGLRLNGSLAAPTQLAAEQRAVFNQLDGFGTFAPITVSFDRDIDFNDLFKRQNDADPANDGVYLVNLLTGALVPLDFGAGRYPYTIDDPTRYFPADPDTGAFNLLFPVAGPAANFFNPAQPHGTVRQQADDLITFYELATHTLILRPVVPLGEDTPYAVVLTNRVQDAQQRPISSPHAGINHASQTHELQPLLRHLPPGTQLSDIAYTWAFTTQSVSRTLNLLRRGLVQTLGPFQLLNPLYAVAVGTTATTASARIAVLQERGTVVPGTASPNPADYILPVNDCAAPPAPACFKALLDDPAVSAVFSGMDPASTPALEASLKYVNYFITGLYSSPDLLTGLGVAGDHTFEADEASSTVRQVGGAIPFLLAIPKEVPAAGHFQPFPTVISGHDFAGNRSTAVVPFAGSFAKFGLATAAIDAYGYGVNVDPGLEALARSTAASDGLAAFADAFFFGRARDLDFDSEPDPGGDFFTADVFHTRDTIRQTVLDWMQLVQVLRSFNGSTKMTVGANGAVLAGDFNLDGVPDLAGARTFADSVSLVGTSKPAFAKNDPNPGADLFTFGVSLGGILSAIAPAVEPEVRATAPVSAGGGLADVALRSSLPQIVGGVYLELLGPFFATCPFSPSSGPADPQTMLHLGACNPSAPDAVPSLVLVVQDTNRERDLPIQPLKLGLGDRLMVQNLSQAGTNAPSCSAGPAVGCGIATAEDASGTVRVPFSADAPQLVGTANQGDAGTPATVTVTVLSPGDALRVTVLPASGGAPTTIATFGTPFTFQGVSYKAGDPLTAPARGFGLNRNTPELRRMMQLVQTALEPADPVNYAPHYTTNNLYLPRLDPTAANGTVAGPLNALLVATSGDTGVPIATCVSLARAAGLVELTQPDPAYNVTDDQVLIRSGAVEGIAATARFDDPNGGAFAQLPGLIQCDNAGPQPCSGAVLVDATGYACNGSACTDGLGAPRLVPPLRQQLSRVSTLPGDCPVSKRATAPGCWSVGASACAPNVPGLSALMIPYMNRTGQTGFTGPQPQKPFDMDQFMANAIGRWFECRAGELHFDACQANSSCPWIPPPPP